MKTFTITKADLDEARKVPWDTTICILAQAIKREFGCAPQWCSPTGFCLPLQREQLIKGAAEVVHAFDRGEKTGDYSDVESVIPVTVEVLS